jgi:hypothetical protein
MKICSIKGCLEKVYARNLCSRHYQKWYHHNDPLKGKTYASRGTLQLEFEAAKQYKGDECWLWPFSCNTTGYPIINRKGRKSGLVHRLMCIAVYGPPPTPKHEACHSRKCKGNRRCINPQHLRWDTSKGNQKDRLFIGTDSRGEKQGGHILVENDVYYIRRNSENLSQVELAKKFGVSRTTIQAVIHGRTWGWLK